MWTTNHPALVAAARVGLRPPGAPAVIGEADAEFVRRAARSDRLSGMMVAALEEGSVEASEAVRAAFVDDWHQQLVACVVVEALVVRCAAALSAASVEWRLTKGAAVAHLDYPTTSWRGFGDADVLIRPDQWDRARRALEDAGCRPQFDTVDDRFVARYGKGVTLDTPEGLELDLHLRFAVGLFGVRSRMEDVFGDDPEYIELAGAAIPVLARPWRLVHACYHAVLGGFGELRAFRDVAQLVHAGARLDDAARLVGPWRGSAVIAEAAAQTAIRLGLDPSEVALSRPIRPSMVERNVLRVFLAERPFRAQALTSLAGLGPRQAADFLAAMVRLGRSRRG